MNRTRGCVIGSLIADAATTPLHWIYDLTKLSTIVSDAELSHAPEFFHTPCCPFYEATTGQLSPYGGEMLALLKGLAKCKGKDFDGDICAQEFADFFSTWQGYKNHTVKTFEANFKQGLKYPDLADQEDNQAAGLVKAPLLAVMYGKSPNFVASTLAALKLTQSRQSALDIGLAATIILKEAIDKGSVEAAINSALEVADVADHVKTELRDVLANKDGDAASLGKAWGISCAYPGAFKLALLAALQSSSFVDGVRANIMLGGDNCSRSVFVGGLLGAAYPESVPEDEWVAKVTEYDQMRPLVEAVLEGTA
eukprot:m.139367 g.139367  ORF g.139367 m.139367 type:complete len:310 (-) comp15941_c4_seq1:90-1019(-)